MCVHSRKGFSIHEKGESSVFRGIEWISEGSVLTALRISIPLSNKTVLSDVAMEPGAWSH